MEDSPSGVFEQENRESLLRERFIQQETLRWSSKGS